MLAKLAPTTLTAFFKPTTRDCVHLVTRGHFRSRDKDGDHIIWSAIANNPYCMQTSWFYVLQNRSYCRSKYYNVEIGIFDLICSCDLDPDTMTFIYELHSYSFEMYWSDELPTSRLSKVIVWHTDRETDRQTDRRPQNYTVSQKSSPFLFLLLLCQMLTDFNKT